MNQEEKKEVRIIFTENSFTALCKNGNIIHTSKLRGKTKIDFTSRDIRELIGGKILEKEVEDNICKFALQNLGNEMIREILKRSPIYSDLASEIPDEKKY